MNSISLSFMKKAGAFLTGVSVFAFGTIFPLNAQQWGAPEPAASETDMALQKEKPQIPNTPNRSEQVKGWGKAVNTDNQENAVSNQVPQNQMQNVQTKAVLSSNAPLQSDDGKIQIYMRDFKVSQTLAGIATCSMKFYVTSTLLTPITNVSFRLKWPDLETPLSFNNVGPNESAFRTQAFAGKLCYTLDRTPNIIVNRCRVKGMTQQDCAKHIEWVK